MRIAILGAGAVGGVIAVLLDRAGHEVEVTARGAHLAAIQEHGLRLDGAWGSHHASLAAGATLTRIPELVIISTKAQDAAAALTANLELIGGATVLVVQNGLDGVTGIRAASPASPIVGGLAMFAASLVEPGHVTVTAAGHTYLGGERAASVARVLASAIPCSVTEDFAGAQWTKLVVNQVNALPAVTGLSVQQVIGDRALRRVLVASMRETVRIGLASGVHFTTLQGLSHGLLRLLSGLPLALGGFVPQLMARRMGSTPNPGSTLQSIRRGQPSEIDYLNGAVVRAAVALGRTAPINAAIVTLVHEVEEAGAFITPTETVRRVQQLSALC